MNLHEIPVISSESLLINASSEVKFVLNLLRYLNDKKDIESLANAFYYLSQNIENNISTHDFIFQGIQHKEETELEKCKRGPLGASLYLFKEEILKGLVSTLLKTTPSQENLSWYLSQ